MDPDIAKDTNNLANPSNTNEANNIIDMLATGGNEMEDNHENTKQDQAIVGNEAGDNHKNTKQDQGFDDLSKTPIEDQRTGGPPSGTQELTNELHDNVLLSEHTMEPQCQPRDQPIPALTQPDPITWCLQCNCKPHECLTLFLCNVITATMIGTTLTLFPPSTHFVNSYSLMPIYGMEQDGHAILSIPQQAPHKWGTNFHMTGYSKEQCKHLQYIQSLNLAMDQQDEHDKPWWASNVSNH